MDHPWELETWTASTLVREGSFTPNNSPTTFHLDVSPDRVTMDDSWDCEIETPITTPTKRSITTCRGPKTFAPFLRLPKELQIQIWKLASADRMAMCRHHDPAAFDIHYSEKLFCWFSGKFYASKLLSPYTPTRIWIAHKLLRQLIGRRRFYGLLATSRLARICALEFWKERVVKNDSHETMPFHKFTDEMIEAFKKRGRVDKARLVQVLDELLALVEVHIEEEEERGLI